MIRPNRVLQIAFVLLALFVLIRFLPMAMRLVQGIASSARTYWWAILPLIIFGFVLGKFKRRPQVRPPLRDVTHSLNEQEP